ncbi:MAG: hypothetical protein IJ751_07445 [Oscillospiraceae bacterium]|nr:hypothetical protein [Oscillospiraceae bacterium]
MKKRVAIICITLALLLSMPAVLLAWGFGLPAQYEDTFMGELKYKVELLENTPGPRIVLVGGSGVAFGADSLLMERELGDYTVVNFGMYAALGTMVMMDLSEPYIREGDIVILIPEQQRQTLSDWFDPAVMWQGLDGAFRLLSSLPRDQLAQLAGEFPAFAGQKFAYYLQGRPPQPQGVYRRDSFNERGDVVSALCARNEMPGGYDANTPIRFDPDMVTEEFARRVRDYARTVAARGAVLWYGLCPMNAAAVEGTAEEIDAFYAALQETLGIPLAGNPRDFILAPGWFYDTNFHPNSSGKTVYTRALIRAVKAMLGDSSPTELALPEMPDMAEAALGAGDNRDGDCFTYEARDGALTITGLTAQGLDREVLLVPTAWDGQGVTAIGAGAFSEAQRLREVAIQQNIRSIADGAFAPCAALERIVMEQDTPSACRVGQGLLDGTSARVYVPPDALSAYRTDYFWSVYGTLILPLEP